MTSAVGAGRGAAVLSTLALTLVASLVSAPPSHAVFDITEVYASTSAEGTDLDSPSNDCLTSGSATDTSEGLRDLPPRREVTVRAVLDPKRGRDTAVVRHYAPCSA